MNKFSGREGCNTFSRVAAMPFSYVILISIFVYLVPVTAIAQSAPRQYTNPVIHADFSDPDAIRDGSKYYMVASSFNSVPGLPILESTDLVNWTIRGYALNALQPYEHFQKLRHGGGVWAPSIRKQKGLFYIYYPDPDFGIYMIRATSIDGPWSEPQLVMQGRGLIDPCPIWDDNGKVYLAFAFAGSRAGLKSVLSVVELNSTGTAAIGQPVLVYDGHDEDATVEGPKFYKRNGYYYIFAPAGGVSTGWQIVLRSKNVYGPYERRKVMEQGASPVNGPHQGAWVETASGESWFLHFQDKEAYGRIVHLQPMTWKNDWPIIGNDPDGDGIGEPVMRYAFPKTNATTAAALQTSDEFSTTRLGLQWQWQANPDLKWAMPSASGYLAMPAIPRNDSSNVYFLPNILSQKFPANEFTATVKLNFRARNDGEAFHFIILGNDYAAISLVRRNGKLLIQYSAVSKAEKATSTAGKDVGEVRSTDVYLRVVVNSGAICQFSYSEDGKMFTTINETFTAAPGKWVGAKIGMACTAEKVTNDAGWARIDWFRISENK